ncbi:MAG: hypothetical protein WBG88_02635 [Mesorhizobium sp.]
MTRTAAAEINELRAQRRANRRKMATASPEVRELCQRLDDVLAALIYKLERA